MKTLKEEKIPICVVFNFINETFSYISDEYGNTLPEPLEKKYIKSLLKNSSIEIYEYYKLIK